MTCQYYYENSFNGFTERVPVIPTIEIFMFILIIVLSLQKTEETEAWGGKDHLVVTTRLGTVPRWLAAKWALCQSTCPLSSARISFPHSSTGDGDGILFPLDLFEELNKLKSSFSSFFSNVSRQLSNSFRLIRGNLESQLLSNDFSHPHKL